MAYNESDYTGDDQYNINCTGDCVVGDSVRFDRAVFTGSFRNAKFSHFERVTGLIIADSYGAAKQQHTFTIELSNAEKIKIKGRNLYKQGVYRQPWQDESLRSKALDEKHTRGNEARKQRKQRLEELQQ